MNASKIKEQIRGGATGFYIGSRMILPFKCQFLKLIVDNHIVTEFVGNKHVQISQEAANTSIYFKESGKLGDFEGSYEYIKLIIAGLEDELTNRGNHLKVICSIEENHVVKLELAEDNDDVLFIE